MKANKVCKKIKIMFAWRQVSLKILTQKNKFINLLIYYKAANFIICFIFSAYAALIKYS